MSIAILSTGNELIEGHTLDTNANHLATILFSEGLPLGFRMTCSDEESHIKACITTLLKDHTGLIILGGLGPTSDDRTRFALGKALALPLIEHPEAKNHIATYLKRKPETLEHFNLQQTLFPQDTTLLANPYGTALGGFISYQSKWVALLPGPPRECIPMFHEQLLLLIPQARTTISKMRWLVFGTPEADIAEKLEPALQAYPCEIGYRLDTPYLEVKVRCAPSIASAVFAVADAVLRPYQLLPESEKASVLLKKKIIDQKIGLTIEDNVTGGHLERLLLTPETYPFLHFDKPPVFARPPISFVIARPPISSVIARPRSGRSNPHHFVCTGLEAYWKQENTTEAHVVLTTITTEKTYSTEKTFFYRSPLIIDIAAEWICAEIMRRSHDQVGADPKKGIHKNTKR